LVGLGVRVSVAGRCCANRLWVAFHPKIELPIEWISKKSYICITGFAELIGDCSREHSGLRLRRFATCLYAWLQVLTVLIAGMQKSAAHNVDRSDVQLSRPVAMGRLHEPYLMRFGPEHGVSKNINDIVIDNLGYLWVATSDGLARYDGSDFRHWRHEPGQAYSLPSNRVFALAVDRLNRLWVASENHLSVLGHDRRGFVHIRFDKTTARCHSDISVLGEGADGAMWVGTVDGALCRIGDGLKPAEVALRDVNRRPVSTSLMIALHATPSGDLWIGTKEGVLLLRNGIINRPLETELGRSRINSLTSEPDGSLLVGGNKGLFRIDLHGRVTNLSGVLPPRAENPIVVADGGSVRWIGTRSGLFRREQPSQYVPGAIFDWFSGRTYSFASKMHTWGLDESLFSGGVYAMVADSDGGLWVVGLTEGLAYLPASWRRFIAVDQVNGERLERKGMIAIATDAGGDGWLLSTTELFHFFV
jgi:ligand-binding sensor domain-containing protein